MQVDVYAPVAHRVLFRVAGLARPGPVHVTARITRCGHAVTRSGVAAYAVTAAHPSTGPTGSVLGPTTPIAATSPGGSWWVFALVAAAALLAGAGLATVMRRRGAR